MAPRSGSRMKIVSPNTGTITHSRSISIVPSSIGTAYTSNEHESNHRWQRSNPSSTANQFRTLERTLNSVDANLPFQPPRPIYKIVSEPLCDKHLKNKAYRLNSPQHSCSDHLQTNSAVLQYPKDIVGQSARRNVLKNRAKGSQRHRLENANDIMHSYTTHGNSLDHQLQLQPTGIVANNRHPKVKSALKLPATIPIHYEGYDSSLSDGEASSSISMASRKRHRSYSAISNFDEGDNKSFGAVKEDVYQSQRTYEGPLLQRHNQPSVGKHGSDDQCDHKGMQSVSNAFHAPFPVQDSNAIIDMSTGLGMFRGLSAIHVTDELFDTKGSISFARPAPRGLFGSRSGTRPVLNGGGYRTTTVLHEKDSPQAATFMQSPCARFCTRPLWSLVGTFKTPTTSVVDVDYVQGCLRWKQRNPKGGFQTIRIPLEGIQDSVVAHITQEDEDIREKQFTAIIRTSTRPSQVVFGFKTLGEAKQMCSMLKKA